MSSNSSCSSTKSVVGRTPSGSAEDVGDYEARSPDASSGSSNRSEDLGISPRLAETSDSEIPLLEGPSRANDDAESSFRPEPPNANMASGVIELEAGSSSADPSKPPAYAPAKRLPKKIYDHVGTTKISKNMLVALFQRCGSPEGVRFLLPQSDERPWTPPNGFICVYAASFLRCGLRFPIPSFLMEFCEAHHVAISQLTPATIRNVVGLMELGALCDVPITCDFYSELTRLSVSPKAPGTFYASSAKGFKIVTGAISKTYLWKDRYFFVEKNAAAFENPNIKHYSNLRPYFGSLLAGSSTDDILPRSFFLNKN